MLLPPAFKLIPCISPMLRTKPLTDGMKHIEVVCYAYSFRSIWRSAPLLPDLILDMGNIVCFDRHLPGKDRRSRSLRLMHLTFSILPRKFKPAFRTQHNRQTNEIPALRTRLRQRTTPFPFSHSPFLILTDKVNRPKSLDVAPIVENKTLGLAGFRRKTKTSAYHLNEKPCTVRRS